jgi:hypothetical protein
LIERLDVEVGPVEAVTSAADEAEVAAGARLYR